MSPDAILKLALLLGAFVTCAGCYGVLYALGRLRRSQATAIAAYAVYMLQCAMTGLLCADTELALGWKVVLTASCLAYFGIPPITWRYLERVHRRLEHQS
jgi:hypothetical protein